MIITSTSNQKVKRIVNLKKKKKSRDEEGVFLVEGVRMFREVPEACVKEIYVQEAFYNKEKELIDQVINKSGASMEILSEHVFQYAADTKTPQGILCVVKQRICSQQEIINVNLHKPALLLILDNIQDPGNLGTILRTAEGAGIDGILMSKDCADIYNPKTIRSTMGSVYRLPFCITEDLQQAVCKVKEAGIKVYAAHLEGALEYDIQDYKGGSAFLIGNEGNGLRREVAELADMYIKIPMNGEVESLNAAVAASVIMFEAGRQRRK